MDPVWHPTESVVMRHVVFGAGAIGCTLAAHLYRTGHTVTLVGRPEQVTTIRRDRLRFTTGDETWMLGLPVTDSPADLKPFTEADARSAEREFAAHPPSVGQLESVGAPRDLVIVSSQNGTWNEPTYAVHSIVCMA